MCSLAELFLAPIAATGLAAALTRLHAHIARAASVTMVILRFCAGVVVCLEVSHEDVPCTSSAAASLASLAALAALAGFLTVVAGHGDGSI